MIECCTTSTKITENLKSSARQRNTWELWLSLSELWAAQKEKFNDDWAWRNRIFACYVVFVIAQRRWSVHRSHRVTSFLNCRFVIHLSSTLALLHKIIDFIKRKLFIIKIDSRVMSHNAPERNNFSFRLDQQGQKNCKKKFTKMFDISIVHWNSRKSNRQELSPLSEVWSVSCSRCRSKLFKLSLFVDVQGFLRGQLTMKEINFLSRVRRGLLKVQNY